MSNRVATRIKDIRAHLVMYLILRRTKYRIIKLILRINAIIFETWSV